MTSEQHVRELLGQDYEGFVEFQNTKWVGPFKIDGLLDNCLDEASSKPPESQSVYLVSRKPWTMRPSHECIPLYVGSTTGKLPRFRARIGDLIADMFGFFQPQGGHSSGGQSLYQYCKRKNVNPKELYIGWLEECGCVRCAEHYFWDLLNPELNANEPPRCRQHFGKDRYLSIFP